MKSLKYLNFYLLRYKTRLLLGTLFVTISNLFAIYPAEILRKGIDMVQQGIEVYFIMQGTAAADELKTQFFYVLLGLGAIVIAAALLKGLFMFFMRQTIIVMSRLIEYDLKNDIYKQYQKLDLAFYKRNKTGDLMARIGEDVSQVRMYVGPAIMYAISTVTLFILVLVKMLSVQPVFTVYVLTPLPLLAVAIYYVNSRVIKKSERVQRQLGVISSRVQESFSGVRVVKAYNREAFQEEQFAADAEAYMQRNTELVQISALFAPMITLLVGLSTIITVIIGVYQVRAGEISAGTIAEFILYVNMLTWPVASIGWVTSIVQRAAASQQRINEFMNQKPEVVNPTQESFNLRGELVFEHVSFTYPESGIDALYDVSFNLEQGKSLAIVGRTGSGKSTLAALITRQYDPTQGTIEVDGKDLREINLSDYRSQLAYVPQEVFLFSETIAENIAFGLNSDGSEQAETSKLIRESADDAAILESIEDFPEQFETRIGERGVTLSGGQKQRISLARALVRNPELLVLDDCLSAVDTATEERVLQRLRVKMKERTSVIVAHRISTIKHCDTIIVLEHGRIAEQGNHEQLLSLEGIYAGMHRKQLLDEANVI
jgi:ATP-binding cassette subfamily B multidrug efflux pump